MLGLYLLFGRFLVDAAIRRRTFYGLTNERLIIVSGLFSQSVRSHMLCSMPEIGLTEHSDGTGTIDFSRSDSIWGFIGMYTSNPWQGVSTYKFERIADARELYSKILDLRRPTST